MSGRYDIPDPKCTHVDSGFVSFPPIDDPALYTAPRMASTRVCGRPACITDAQDWVEAKTGRPGVYTTDAERAAVRTNADREALA